MLKEVLMGLFALIIGILLIIGSTNDWDILYKDKRIEYWINLWGKENVRIIHKVLGILISILGIAIMLSSFFKTLNFLGD